MEPFEEIEEKYIQTLLKSRHRVIESIGKNMDLYGVTLSIGHLYGNMYFSEHPVTLDEMVQTMGMSKTSMSTGMRTLMDLKMVHKVWEKGARKDLFVAEPDWYQTFIDFFSVKWRKSIEQNVAALNRSLRELEQLLADIDNTEAGDEARDHDENAEKSARLSAFRESVATDIEKINNALSYYRWLGRLIDALESEKIFQFIPKEPVD